MNDRKPINFAGGSQAASHFLLLRQNKVAKEKATPVCRPYGVLSISRKQAGLRNSHFVLKHNQRLDWRRLPAVEWLVVSSVLA